MPESPRFVADIMLGKLARWLRILGHDVRYSNRFGDDEIVRLARSEKRVILTRDLPLMESCGPEAAVLIRSGDLDAQMRQLIRERGLTRGELFSRCLVCNRQLEPVARSDVSGRVPPYVYRTQERFRSCPECGRIYWPGTHGDDVRERVARWFGEA